MKHAIRFLLLLVLSLCPVLAHAASVVLTWGYAQNSENPATGFTIERCAGSRCTSSFVLLTPTPLPLNQLTYTDSDRLVAGQTYRWRIQAVSAGRISHSSTIINVTIPPDPHPLNAPSGLQGDVQMPTRISLAWDAPIHEDGTPVLNLGGYTVYSGSDSNHYQTMFDVDRATTYFPKHVFAGQTTYFAVTARTTSGEESPFSNEISVTIRGTPPAGALIPQEGMRIVSVDTQAEGYAAANVLDGDPATLWVTPWGLDAPAHPHTLVIELGGHYEVDGFTYVPRHNDDPDGTIAAYEFYVSPDGLTWGPPAVAGTLVADATEKTMRFPAIRGRFVRLVALSEIARKPYTSAAELYIFGAVGSTAPLP